MSLKRLINSVVGISGYQFARVPSVALDIERRRYDWIRQRNIRTVLDVGANTGQFATMIRQILPDAQIWSFEPIEEAHRGLVQTGKRLGNMRCLRMALGETRGQVDMHRNVASASSSILPLGQRHLEAYPHARESRKESVELRTLDDVCAETVPEKGVLLKLDTQGYELSVLKGAARILPSIDTIIVETSFVPLYEGQPLFDDVYEYLRSRSFEYRGNLESSHDPEHGEILWEDSLFLRRQEGPMQIQEPPR